MRIVEKSQLMSAPEIDRTLQRLAHEIVEKSGGTKNLALIGIVRRGVPLAQRIAQAMRGIDGVEVPVGVLDITLYRDDLSKVAPQAVLRSSNIPFGVDNMELVLVDDVLYTGRTIRAAMNGLFDLGRPKRVSLCVLIERGHREMSIEWSSHELWRSNNPVTFREGTLTHRFRDLLALEPLTADELGFLLDQSKPFQEIQKHPLKKLATLRGKTVALAFFETSTRTRISFGTAASRLGADTMNLQAEASSLKKGETLLDTVFNLNAMKPDCLVMRHAASGAPHYVARHLDIPVVNAGDGTHEHPSQGLLDALTIRDRLGTIKNLSVTILGDILHSRVARSNIHLLGKFGCRFTLCGPAMWVPRELEKIAPGTPIRCVYRIEEPLR